MKKLLSLFLTLALCLPMFMTNSIEAKASQVSQPDDYKVYLDKVDAVFYENSHPITSCNFVYEEKLKEVPVNLPHVPGIKAIFKDPGMGNHPTPPAEGGVRIEWNRVNITDKGGLEYFKVIDGLKGVEFKFPEDVKVGDRYTISFTIEGINLVSILKDNSLVKTSLSDESGTFTIVVVEGTSSNPLEGSSVSENSTSESESTSTAPAPTEEEIHAMKVAEIEARQKKSVTFSDGRQVKTEISGVYEVASLSGTAVTTPKADVQKAAGLTDEQITDGTNVSTFMGNLYDKTVKDALSNAVVASGKNLLTMFISDMYTITKTGQMTKLHTITNPVSVVIGLPKNAVDANRVYSVICLTATGQVIEMQDVDTDASTITINATAFGSYAIVYK